MKLTPLLLPIVLFCSGASAQMPASMNQQDMQAMMAAMQEMQSCFMKIDQNAVKALQQRSLEFSSELQSLCKNGERSQAQDKAMAYYKEMMADTTVKQVKACSEKIPASLKSMAKMPLDYSKYAEELNRHVCDLQQVPAALHHP